MVAPARWGPAEEELRVASAWWRVGSSALEPRLLLVPTPLDRLGPVAAELATHGGVDLAA